jgi:rhamnose transport system permease protein
MIAILSKHRRELSVAAVYLIILLALARQGRLHPDRNYFHQQFRDDCISAAPLLVLGVGMTFIILARQIDISIGSQFSVCVVLAALSAKMGWPMPVVILVPLVFGMLMGAFNGALVGFGGLPSIVVTLATMVLLRDGLSYIREGAAVVGLPDNFQWFGASQNSGMRMIVLGALVIWGVFVLASRYLSGARSVYAVGSDFEAARLAGLRPRHVTFFVFVLMGGLTGLAGLLFAVQFPQAFVNSGTGFELRVIAAVVVGGTAISGGRGTLVGTLAGTILLGTIASMLHFFNIRAQWELAIQGAIILAAVASDALAVRRSA